MMKKSILFGLILVLTSCGSTVESFYDAHKNDTDVTAVRVPKFMYSMLGNSSPEMRDFVGNISDIRYINIPANSSSQNSNINTEIDKITQNGYADIFRKNNEQNRSLLTVKEKGNTIKQIILHNSSSNKNSLLYLKGNFDANKIKQMAEGDGFSTINSLLEQKY